MINKKTKRSRRQGEPKGAIWRPGTLMMALAGRIIRYDFYYLCDWLHCVAHETELSVLQ